MKTDNYTGLRVLLADDDPDDCLIFDEAVQALELGVQLNTIADGERLMQFLLNPVSELPDMLFLDLNMPFKNGYQCLNEIRANERLKDIFIIVYSTTANPREIEKSFGEKANLFIKKPDSFTELKVILSKVFKLDLNEYNHPEKTKFVLEA